MSVDANNLVTDAVPWALTGGAGFIGRLMYHASLVQAGKRKPLSWMLFWDIPIAIGMGWLALGLGVMLHTAAEATISLALACAYLGPHIIDLGFSKWAERKLGGSDGKESQ